MAVLLIILGFATTGLIIWLAALTSPDGYEDETGFHFGIKPEADLQKRARKVAVPSRVSPKVTSQKKPERKSAPRTRQPVPEWETPDAYADQMNFPFPVPR